MGHGGEFFSLGDPVGVMACGDDDALWGCDPRVGATMAAVEVRNTRCRVALAMVCRVYSRQERSLLRYFVHRNRINETTYYEKFLSFH